MHLLHVPRNLSAYRLCFDTTVNRHMKYQNRKTTDRNKVLYILRGILAVPGISMKYFLGKIQFKEKPQMIHYHQL